MSLQVLIGRLVACLFAVTALSAGAVGQIPAVPAPERARMTPEEADEIRAREFEAAIARGEYTRRNGIVLAENRATPETLFILNARPYPGAPRWYERAAVTTLLTGLWRGSQLGRADDFALSRDGRWIAMSRPDFPQNELYLIEARTGEGWRLRYPVETLEFFHPAFSPTEDVLAVAVHAMPRFGLGEIWLLNMEGALVDRVVTPRHAQSSPTFSPDGRRLAFLETARWEVTPGATGLDPEYANATGAAIVRPIVLNLETRDRCVPTDAFFSATTSRRLIFSADGRALIFPTAVEWDIFGPNIGANEPQIWYHNFPELGLPADAAVFTANYNRYSIEELRFGLSVRVDRHDGPVLVPNAPPRHSASTSLLIGTASGHNLFAHQGETVTADGQVVGWPQTLSLEGPDGQVRILRTAPPGAMLSGGLSLRQARVSEDLCTLAFYENWSLEHPIIRVVDLCSDAAEFLIDVEATAARLPLLETGWEIIND